MTDIKAGDEVEVVGQKPNPGIVHVYLGWVGIVNRINREGRAVVRFANYPPVIFDTTNLKVLS